MRYKASISYDGSKFYGFQRLKNKLNIQETLEKALTKINKSLVVVKGAGRTALPCRKIKFARRHP